MAEPNSLVGEFSDSKKYQLHSKISSGGMGTIYRAYQLGAEGFKKDVAIKMILSDFSENSEFVRLFIGEAKLVADLVHENIVQVYHLGKAEGQYFMALEYVDGIDLQRFMKQHVEQKMTLDPDLGAFIISRICRALEYAHDKRDRNGRVLNIVHRDVSPRNIMINFQGVVKLTDFGIAKALRVMEQQEKSVLMGKAAYLSPEQARFEGTDRRSDLFSLGIVMYELLTGERLFFDQSPQRTIENVKSLKIPDPRSLRNDLPEGLVKILLKALERNASRRYQSAGEMGYDLEYFMYHNRFGPTNVTLGEYVCGHFPEERLRAAPMLQPSSGEGLQTWDQYCTTVKMTDEGRGLSAIARRS